MHRSASTSRASDEFFINLSPASKASPGVKVADVDILDPIPDTSKKETPHLKSLGENSIHLIPIVLILCAITLWASSHPVTHISKSGHSHYQSTPVVKVEGLNIHGNKTTFLSTGKLKELDQQKGSEGGQSERVLVKESG